MEPELTRVCGRLLQSVMVLGKRSIDMLAIWLKVVGIGYCVLWYLIWME
jgi:hypothetical protein